MMLLYIRMLRLLSLILLWLAAACPAFAQPLEARSEHFILRSEAAVDAQALLSDLEVFRVAVLTDLGLSPGHEGLLRLNIIDDPDVFAAISPGGITAAIYLQSAPGSDIVIGFSRDPQNVLSQALDPGWLRLTLRHELVHHILEAHYPRKLPIWLGEGLAEYYATFEFSPDGLARFGRALPEQTPLSETGAWLPMRTVIESMARYPQFDVTDAGAFFEAQRTYYSQSWALANFVMRQPDGLSRVHRFVDYWQPDTDSEDSFEQAFGLRYGPLEARMRDDLSIPRPVADRTREPQPSPRPITLTPQSMDMMMANRLRLLLSHGRVDPRTEAGLDRLWQTVSVETPDLKRARAHYYWRQKDWDASDALTRQRLETDSVDAQALLIRAKTAYGRVSDEQMNLSLWDDAEAIVGRALMQRPDDAELHLFRVAVSLPGENGLPAPARTSLRWLIERDTHLRMPHSAMMMIPALIYEGELDHADAVLDSAARWSEGPADRAVIDRLRESVATERLERSVPQ